MKTVTETFGSMVFDDRVMKATLSAKVYASLRHTIDEGASLDPGVADAVARRADEKPRRHAHAPERPDGTVYAARNAPFRALKQCS